MGSFSIFHWAIFGIILLLPVVAGIAIAVVLTRNARK
ncbi:MAG: hypothetical protein JWM94_2541 [Sphingomonas bacterium]|nr:hypothetical protein [Sphingomonas bacterium]